MCTSRHLKHSLQIPLKQRNCLPDSAEPWASNPKINTFYWQKVDDAFFQLPYGNPYLDQADLSIYGIT